MRHFKNTVASLIGVAVLATAPLSANAMAVKPASITSGQTTDVVNIQSRRFRRGGRSFRGGRGFRRGFGFRNRGFRRNRGGIFFGHTIYSRGFSTAHYNWCHKRYRSYHARTNTFQPFKGRRKQCLSPFI